jgi:mRNA-degrading endonuclease toxin of MazEF toxin-antitoxin module
MATPRRGEVWLIDFAQAGKTRPALVVSVAFGNRDRALSYPRESGSAHDKKPLSRAS